MPFIQLAPPSNPIVDPVDETLMFRVFFIVISCIAAIPSVFLFSQFFRSSNHSRCVTILLVLLNVSNPLMVATEALYIANMPDLGLFFNSLVVLCRDSILLLSSYILTESLFRSKVLPSLCVDATLIFTGVSALAFLLTVLLGHVFDNELVYYYYSGFAELVGILLLGLCTAVYVSTHRMRYRTAIGVTIGQFWVLFLVWTLFSFIENVTDTFGDELVEAVYLVITFCIPLSFGVFLWRFLEEEDRANVEVACEPILKS